MIGNRIRLARLANCLSLQQLSDRMKENNLNITKTALFNYESNVSVPSPQALAALSTALGVNEHFFSHESLENFSLKLLGDLGSVESRKQELLAYIQLQIEYLISVSEKAQTPLPTNINAPSPITVFSAKDASVAADSVRKYWNLGDNPISSVCSILEDNGLFLFSLPKAFQWGCVSGIETSHNIHFIFFSSEIYLDDLRMGLLKEFGKHVMVYDAQNEQEILEEFAAAVLLPKSALCKNFGKKRSNIDYEELRCIKKKYGISRLTTLKRLNSCGIISNETCYSLIQSLRQSYHISHSSIHHVALNFYEEPIMLHLLVRRAIAEGFILNENDLDYKSAWAFY